MAIRITVGSPSSQEVFEDPKEQHIPEISINLNVRKALNGDYMIMAHDDIDIIVSPEENKIVLFPKDRTIDHDIVYDTQNRMFKYLIKRGVVDPLSVKGGSLYSTFEGVYYGSDDDSLNADQVILFTIAKFIEEEKPYFKASRERKKRELDFLFNPSEEYSTELGDIPQEKEKGTINPSGWPAGAAYRIYENRFPIVENTGGYFKNFERVVSLIAKQKEKEKWDDDFYIGEIRALAKKLFGNSVDCGSFRCIFNIDEERILKVANPYVNGAGARHNSSEANNLMTTKYPDLFPKIYERAPDFSWIVVEKVTPFGYDVDSGKLFLSYFPEEFSKEYLDVFRVYDSINNVLKWLELAADFFEQGTRDEFTNYGKGYKKSLSKPAILQLKKDEEFLKKYKPNRLMNRLVQFIVEFNAAPWDFKPRNCGYNSHGEFVLLDASIFGSKDGTADPRPTRI